jgi:hypothetical protein
MLCQRSDNVEPTRVVGRALITLGVTLATIGVLLVLIVLPLGSDDAASVVSRFPVFLQNAISRIPEGTPLLVVELPGAIAFAAGVALLKRGRRYFVATYRAGLLRPSENTILYLRPFVADKTPVPYTTPLDTWVLAGMFDMRVWTGLLLRLRGVTRYEEFIAYAFRRLGTLVTIGDPTEQLPQLGATRVYVPSSGSVGSVGTDAWQTEVAKQIACAKLILLHVGSSAGIRWEIERVIAVADPRRVVLCVYRPGKRKPGLRNLDSAHRSEVKTVWKEFREAHGAIFPHGLPETIGDGRFIKFDANWTAVPLQAKRGIIWFFPSRTGRLRRDTIDGTLVWLSWVMVPDRFARRLVRRLINFATCVIIFFAALILAVITLAPLISRS